MFFKIFFKNVFSFKKRNRIGLVFAVLCLLHFLGTAVWAQDTYYFTLNSAPGVAPSGDSFTTTTPSSNAYTPTDITSTPLYFYTGSLGCTYNAGPFNVSLIMHQISGNTDLVNVELDVVSSSGAFVSAVGNETLNVDTSCTAPTGDACNGLVTYTITNPSSLTLSGGQQFCVKITLESADPVTTYSFPSSTAFVPGSGWISELTTTLNSCDPPTVTPTPLPCGWSPSSVASGTNTLLWSNCYGTTYNQQSAATGPSNDSSNNPWYSPNYNTTFLGWNPAVIVPTPETGWAQPCSIAGSGSQSYWTSVVANQAFSTPTPPAYFSPCGGSFYYLNYFTIPTPQPGYSITSALLTMAADDGNQNGEAVSVFLNGTPVPGASTVNYSTCTTFSVPLSDFNITGSGNNVLAVYDSNGQGFYQGMVYQFLFAQTGPTCTPTNTFTDTPTNSMNTSTNTCTQTATSTPTNTATNISSNTATNTATSTTMDTFTPTPTITPTNTPTFTATVTATYSPSNTLTITLTNTPTDTPTDTDTITPTQTPSNTPTITTTATSTNSPTNTPSITFTYTPMNTFSPTDTNTPTNTATNTNTVGPVVAISKKASESTAQAGDTITYDVVLSVSGSAASNVMVQDTLPANLAFTGFGTPVPSVAGTPNQTGSILTWNFATLPVGTYTLPYQASVTNFASSIKPLFNQAWVTFSGGAPVTASCQVALTGSYTLKIGIYNSAGELVKQLLIEQVSQSISNISLQPGNIITALQGTGSTIQIYYQGNLIGVWDGSNENGNPVMNGNYVIKVDNISSTGLVTSVEQQAVVNRSLSNVTANIFNSSGELVRALYSVVDNANDLQMTNVILSSQAFNPGAVTNGFADNLKIIVATSGTPVTLIWDGSNDSGTVVTPGAYVIQLHWDNGQGTTTNITQTVIVVSTGSSGVVVAEPNMLTPGQGMSTLFNAIGVVNAFTVNVNLYTIAGELVKSIQGTPGTLTANWNASGFASGIYICSVQVLDSNGDVLKCQTLKVLVMH